MTTDEIDESTAQIAQLNDTFRKGVMMPVFGKPDVPGRTVLTRGIAALDPVAQIEICAMVRDYDEFGMGDDPYGEHDFGAFTYPVAGTVFWKIDYYADQSCRFGSEAPEDPARSFRVLTIMLAGEW